MYILAAQNQDSTPLEAMNSSLPSRIFILWYLLTSCLLLSGQGTPFTPDDPYFFPGTEQGAAEGYYGQWHLVNSMPVGPLNAGLDVNILGAWNKGYTGAGVIIGIVDDGVDSAHPDLAANFYNQYSWSFDKSQVDNLESHYRGTPGSSDNHGTSVAGVAAGVGGNGIGITGAAPRAGVAALNFLTEAPLYTNPIAAEVAAILYQGQTDTDGNLDPYASNLWISTPVKVKNHSYGEPISYDKTSQEPIIQAFMESIAHGVIHVRSAGNGRQRWADTGKRYAATIPGMIAVAALGADGIFTSYSNYGSNVFVTAPTGDDDLYNISTTDRQGTAGYNNFNAGEDPYFETLKGTDGLNYTSQFDGTSSASPLVAGIMALGVQANPNLNARMAQHIMVRTNRIINASDSTRVGGWVTNGAGRSFNRNYGFGLIDATAFVEMAEQSVGVTGQTEYDSGTLTVNTYFEAEHFLVRSHEVLISPEALQPIEYIQIHLVVSGLVTDWSTYINGTGSIMGDLEGWLTSPSGTRQMLFANDHHITGDSADQRSHFSDTLDWTFLSYAYWGEDPNGLWSFELHNDTGNSPEGVLWENFALTIGMGDLILVPEPPAVALLAIIGLFVLWRSYGRRSS